MSVRRVLTPLVGVLLVSALAGLVSCTSGGGTAGSANRHGQAVTVSDATGPVTLKAPARRVVALGWAYAEDLLAVGASPVGMSEKAAYSPSVAAGPRPGRQVEDVGNEQQPDIRSITRLRPDLIITAKSRPRSDINQLREIAPVLVFDPNRPDMSGWQEMRATFGAIATAVDRSDQARNVLAQLDASLARARQKLADAGKSHTPSAVAQGYSRLGVPTIRVFTTASLAGDVLTQLGLQNAWRGRPEKDGYVTVDAQELAPVSMADFLYVASTQDNPFVGMLARNAAWTDLDFVKTDRVHALDPRTWLFGGPTSTEYYIDEVVRALS